MKKNIIIAVVVIILAGGGFWFYRQNAKPKPIYEDPYKGEKKGLTVLENITLEGWMKRGKPVECTITTTDGTTKIMTKDGKIRLEGMIASDGGAKGFDANAVTVVTDDWVYFWSGNQGTKMNNKEIAARTDDKQTQDFGSYSDWEQTVKDWDAAGVKYDCEEKRLSDDLFSEPKDVTFNDITNLFKDIPEVGNKFEGMTQEQIEAELDKMNLGQTMTPEQLQKQIEETSQ